MPGECDSKPVAPALEGKHRILRSKLNSKTSCITMSWFDCFNETKWKRHQRWLKHQPHTWSQTCTYVHTCTHKENNKYKALISTHPHFLSCAGLTFSKYHWESLVQLCTIIFLFLGLVGNHWWFFVAYHVLRSYFLFLLIVFIFPSHPWWVFLPAHPLLMQVSHLLCGGDCSGHVRFRRRTLEYSSQAPFYPLLQCLLCLRVDYIDAPFNAEHSAVSYLQGSARVMSLHFNYHPLTKTGSCTGLQI